MPGAAAQVREKLRPFVETVSVVPGGGGAPVAPDPGDQKFLDLALAGAVLAGATHLITGDVRDFGKHFGQKVLGVTVLPPAGYLRSRP